MARARGLQAGHIRNIMFQQSVALIILFCYLPFFCNFHSAIPSRYIYLFDLNSFPPRKAIVRYLYDVSYLIVFAHIWEALIKIMLNLIKKLALIENVISWRLIICCILLHKWSRNAVQRTLS